MSYCRWSSDDWKCDLYCYEDAGGGWTTHVAGRRRIGEVPPDFWDKFVAQEITPKEYTKLHNEQMEVLSTLPFEDITLPHAGETFNDPTLGAFKARLVHLRSLGYHFPDYVLDTIDKEIRKAVRDGA